LRSTTLSWGRSACSFSIPDISEDPERARGAVPEERVAGLLDCVDSVDWESRFCFWSHPAERIRRHRTFEEYILNEAMPLMAMKTRIPAPSPMGAAWGPSRA
jgi:hypothetical protein